MSARVRLAKLPLRSLFDWNEVETLLIGPGLLSDAVAVKLYRAALRRRVDGVEELMRRPSSQNVRVPDEPLFSSGYLALDPEAKFAWWKTLLPELSKKCIQALINNSFVLHTMKVREIHSSPRGGDTAKIVFELQDGYEIETCIMRFGLPAREEATAKFTSNFTREAIMPDLLPAKNTETHSNSNSKILRKSKTDCQEGWDKQLVGVSEGPTPMELAAGAKPGKTTKLRATVCVSCQCGCAQGCSFCSTGLMKFQANLGSGEIVEQVLICNEVERVFRHQVFGGDGPSKWLAPVADGRYISNIVYMGMGEFCASNYKENVASVKALIKTFGFSPAKITISTVGAHVHRIRDLQRDLPRVCLALSLHAPTQAKRDSIVPTSKGSTIDGLLSACFDFVDAQRLESKLLAKHRHLLIEYCLIKGVNDEDADARAMVDLFRDKIDKVILNIIPYNPTPVLAQYEAPTLEGIVRFVSIIKREGFKIFVRHEHGQDIVGACGQLIVRTGGYAPKQSGQKEQKAQAPASPSAQDERKAVVVKEEKVGAGQRLMVAAGTVTNALQGLSFSVRERMTKMTSAQKVALTGVALVVGAHYLRTRLSRRG